MAALSPLAWGTDRGEALLNAGKNMPYGACCLGFLWQLFASPGFDACDGVDFCLLSGSIRKKTLQTWGKFGTINTIY